MLIVTGIIEVIVYFAKFTQTKFPGSFFFGYFSHLVWHEHKPRTFLKNVFDTVIVPVAFGHVGGSINFHEID